MEKTTYDLRQEKKTKISLDKICAFLFAIVPILQHYVGIYKNAGITVLILIFPILLFKLIALPQNRIIYFNNFIFILPIMIFELYTVIGHSISLYRLFYVLFICLTIFCIFQGCIEWRLFYKYSISIANFSVVVVITQNILYFGFRYHLRVIPVNLLLEGSDRWIGRAQYGIINAADTYRASGIFLEPSHMFLYLFPLICFSLLSNNNSIFNKKQSIFLSIGIVLSTSGMGIGVVIGIWLLYFIIYNSKGKSGRINVRKLLSFKNILFVLLIVVGVCIAYLSIPLFRYSIDRIFYSEVGSTAIEGRTRLANELINGMSGVDVLLGKGGFNSEIDFNMPGFHSTYYKWGIIGILLTYGFYVQGIFKLHGAGRVMSVIIVVISFFTAHTHGTMYMLYFSTYLLYSQSTRKNKDDDNKLLNQCG